MSRNGLVMGLSKVARAQRGVLVGVAVLVGLVVAVPMTSGAAPGPYSHGHHPHLKCPHEVAAGHSATVSGKQFPAGQTVALTFDGGSPIGSSTTTAKGSFSTGVAVPATATTGSDTITATASGHHAAIATCEVQVVVSHG